jgi:TldD protein
MKDLALLALDTAKSMGASYADARFLTLRRQNLFTEDHRVDSINDESETGFGIRVICGGAWGFAGSSILTREEVMRVAAEACAIAASSASSLRNPVTWAPETPRQVSFLSPREIDPFAVGVDRKVGLLLEINDRLLRQNGVKKAHGYMTLRQDQKLFANTDGSLLESDVVTTGVQYQATAVGNNDAKSRAYVPPPLTRGYENIDEAELLAQAERVAQQAVEHLSARDCPAGRRDLILDPHNLALTIHESVGHATELDRVLGYEESLAGRSFATTEKLNNLQYGSDLVTFRADNTLEEGLATHGFDDDGVEGQAWNIVDHGLFAGYSMGREVAAEMGFERSNGSCRADHWGSIPIVRIPNLSLMPGQQPLTLEEIISDTDDGIYIEGMGSFSIDQMRCNFQFGGDAFWEIKNGKIVGMLKNVTYQAMTTDFWNSCDAIADERFWVKNGVLNCGKGDPMQISQMSHGAAPARFRNIAIGGAR